MRKRGAAIIAIFSLLLLHAIFIGKGNLTGFFTYSENPTGCCTAICKETSKDSCFGEFKERTTCRALDECNLGCCVDTQGYCLSNYLAGNCEAKGGEFVGKEECAQYFKCLMPSKNPLVGFIGYPLAFTTPRRSVQFVSPISGTSGDRFTISAVVFEPENVTEVSARVYTDGLEQRFNLYDDGRHNDRNAGDGLFAGIWDSAGYRSIEPVKKFYFKTAIDGVESDYEDYFLLSGTGCVPASAYWDDPARRKDVIFAYSPKTTEGARLAGMYLQNAFGLLLMNPDFANDTKKMNFYFLRRTPIDQDALAMAKEVKTYCTFYDQNKDKAIILTEQEDYCEIRNGRISVNPAIWLKKSAKDVKDLDYLLDHFCDYVLTKREVEDEMYLYYPNVTLISPTENQKFNESEVTVKFTAKDNSKGLLDYKLYLDTDAPQSLLANGTFQSGKVVEGEYLIPDGNHIIWAEVTDTDHNLGMSQAVSIGVDAKGYTIDILSLDPLRYEYSPEINFTIKHKVQAELSYRVYADSDLIGNGTARNGAVVNLQANLSNGTYNIMIASDDDDNATARSMPYLIVIDKRMPNPNDGGESDAEN